MNENSRRQAAGAGAAVSRIALIGLCVLLPVAIVPAQDLSYDGYGVTFHDEFDGDELNREYPGHTILSA
ncbi:MAG: hypothetical protein GF418_04435, partial [Chitinivibrionales bacterium]|nr:hypothetical protein [Chitinivibrionales bacterium]